jgi:hypothetical protein
VSNGRVCQKHIESPVTIYNQCVGCELECLQQQLADRDKMIAEFGQTVHRLGIDNACLGESYGEWRRRAKHLEKQNTLMLEALEFYGDKSNWIGNSEYAGPGAVRLIPSKAEQDRGQRARDTLAKVKGGDNQ